MSTTRHCCLLNCYREVGGAGKTAVFDKPGTEWGSGAAFGPAVKSRGFNGVGTVVFGGFGSIVGTGADEAPFDATKGEVLPGVDVPSAGRLKTKVF